MNKIDISAMQLQKIWNIMIKEYEYYIDLLDFYVDRNYVHKDFAITRLMVIQELFYEFFHDWIGYYAKKGKNWNVAELYTKGGD